MTELWIDEPMAVGALQAMQNCQIPPEHKIRIGAVYVVETPLCPEERLKERNTMLSRALAKLSIQEREEVLGLARLPSSMDSTSESTEAT